MQKCMFEFGDIVVALPKSELREAIYSLFPEKRTNDNDYVSSLLRMANKKFKVDYTFETTVYGVETTEIRLIRKPSYLDGWRLFQDFFEPYCKEESKIPCMFGLAQYEE